jgi:hypothetical protein
VTDHGVAEMRDACVVEKNGTYGLCLERHGFARVDTRTAKALRGGLENPHEAVLTTPDSPGVVVVSDGDGATLADAEEARAFLARRTRRLAPGAETQTHLHGEAVEGKWLEACGVEQWVDAIGYDG